MASTPRIQKLYDSISHLDSNSSSREQILTALTNLVPQLAALDATHDTLDDDVILKFASHIAELITPRENVVDYDRISEESTSETMKEAIALTQELAREGLTALSHLYTLTPTPASIEPAILFIVIAYSSPIEPWTTPTNVKLSQSLLTKLGTQLNSASFIIKDVFTDFIRPLFVKTKKLESITTTGRKAMPSSAPPARFDASRELDHENMPWRYEIPYAVTILDWAVQNIAEKDIKPNLHLILPPLLHLLDTTSLALRHRGLLILPFLVKKMSPQVLTQTGLGSVFEDAIVPSLMYLPTLTPLPESLSIVKASWDALLVLHDTLFRSTPSSEKTSSSLLSQRSTPTQKEDLTTRLENQRIKFLLAHLREEWFQAWSFTYPSHPPLSTLLLQILTTLIPLLGVHTTSHLKDIIPILSTLLLDPFILSTPEGRKMYSGAIDVLREVVLTCWMRVASDEGRRMEVLGLLVGVWKALKEREEDGGEIEELWSQLGIVGRIFVKAVEAGDQGVVEKFRSDLVRLVEVDKRVSEVFGLRDRP